MFLDIPFYSTRASHAGFIAPYICAFIYQRYEILLHHINYTIINILGVSSKSQQCIECNFLVELLHEQWGDKTLDECMQVV